MQLSGFLQDIGFAIRQVRRAPAFAISAVLTLALGVGANTGIFGLLNGYFRPLPVPNGDAIVILAAEMPGDETGLRYRFSFPALQDYRAQSTAFSDIFAFATRMGGLTAGGKSTTFLYHGVSGNFFAAMQLRPALGRLFSPGEGEHLGSELVAVLGHGFWMKRFGGDPGVIGMPVRLDGRPARIIGVLPPGFHGFYQGVDIEGYITLADFSGRDSQQDRFFTDRTLRILTVGARLRPGVTLGEAQASVNVIANRLQATQPAERDVTVRVIPEPLARPYPMRFLSDLLPLIERSMLGLAALVLLIACMNVANLLMVRATARQREMAVRVALGSGRQRLLRLLLVESLLLAAAGTLLGLLFARWATDLFLGSINLSMELPLNLEFDFDWRVFAYAAIISLATGILMGIVPALRASRTQVTGVLHDGGHGSSAGGKRQRMRSALAIAQVAGSLVLLVVAGLLMRSLQRAQHADLGFDPANVLVARIDPRQLGYSIERTTEFFDELDRKLKALPGVESTAMAFAVPLGYIFDSCQVWRASDVVEPGTPQAAMGCNPVTPTYFETLRIPLVRGRGFTEQDTVQSPLVVIVNETLARQLWPGQDPIGRHLHIPRLAGMRWEVVGVARDSKYMAVFEGPLPHVYFPYRQTYSTMRVVHIRSSLPPSVLGPQVQQAVHSLDPDMPVADLMSMKRSLEGGGGVLMFRIGATQATAMGLLGLLLSIVGIYGVVSYGASQRTREMGIRLALGAAPRAVGGLILRQGVTLVGAGIVAGLAITGLVTRAIGRFFVLVSAGDPLTLGTVTAILGATAIVACYLPARRTMRVDPIVALRHE
jgi:macrolide transport system ATP-binding/permease protein